MSAQLSKQQARTLLDLGFRYGFAGFPVLFSENGQVTVVEEGSTRLIVWTVEPDGSALSRTYERIDGYEVTMSIVR